ncbi:MAG: hypothetical protein WGN25_04550 [Candidatus Electrothrix sp. GW3-4]|uniref:hypothetical protein n=1 Tax=Candidatus Electrothrix sp. GW3-4 TaxID=3126740 RepID=UPI0030D1E5B0
MVEIPFCTEYVLLRLMKEPMESMMGKMVAVAVGLWLRHIYQKTRSAAGVKKDLLNAMNVIFTT